MDSQLMAANSTQRMSLDGDHTSDERDYLSDDESLFGTPPPSPSMGNVLSLALPSERLDSEQNVGTLALPGSHNPSKLPVDSVVCLLDARHRPLETRSPRASTPARMTTSFDAPPVPAAANLDPTPRSSRSTTSGVSRKRKRAKNTSKPALMATPGPSIELPPSDAPVPPNFLRNQQALLGIAGLVANINPASLSSHRHNQGNNPRNPIVVEDGAATLPLFEQPVAPTPAQLLATLSAQKDIFPVLEQLLGILRRGSDLPIQPPLNPPQPPSKRRKLSRVPAGAADWDVPFPFPPGEGPPNYKEEWTNERCERLISDFIALLREGTNKAAARASAKRASSQPAPQPPTQSHPTSTRRSLPPTNNNRCSPSSNYVPLPLDVYLRPTVPHSYATFPPTPANTQSLESCLDLLTAAFESVLPPHDSDLPNSHAFGASMDPLPLGFDLDPLLLNLMGTGPFQEGPSGSGSPAPSSEEAPTPALSHSPCPSQSVTSGPSPMTPNFDPSFAMYSPSGSTVNQQDRVASFGPAPHLESQDGLELGIDVDDDFSRVFGMEADMPCQRSVANQPPHLCDPPSVELELPVFPGLELPQQGSGTAGEGISSANATAPNASMPPSVPSQGTPDTTSLSAPQKGPLPSSSNTKLPTFTTASLQRQRPVPKRSTLPISPSKSKTAATFVAAKKRREDAIQQGRDLRRQLMVDIGKSKVQLWELTMEQGVLTRMSKDERLARS